VPAGVHPLFGIAYNQSKSSHCTEFPQACNAMNLVEAGKLQCLGIRNCDVEIDEDMFHTITQQAIRIVVGLKRSPFTA
jgi:hypothetical protein